MSSLKKFTFGISSPDEFLVLFESVSLILLCTTITVSAIGLNCVVLLVRLISFFRICFILRVPVDH